MKGFQSIIKLEFEGNNLEAETKDEYIDKLKELYLELYNLDIQDHEIQCVKKIGEEND